MKKIIFVVIISAFVVAAFSEERAADDAITDIEDTGQHYERGSYKVSTDGDTLTVKKGEGFDFNVPEIIITGQVDTKIMLQREITSLENLQDVKSLLYEEGRINMPYSYMKESELTPQSTEGVLNRDFAGRLKLSGGTMYRFGGSGLVGKVFDEDNSVVLKVMHENYNNPVVNSRETYRNLNRGDFFYNTEYYPVKAAYKLSFQADGYVNPYPENVFSGEVYVKHFDGGGYFSGEAGGFDFDIFGGYAYTGQENTEGKLIFKESRVELKSLVEKDFRMLKDSKIKTIFSAEVCGSDVFGEGVNTQGVIDASLFFKGIMYFEPFIVQGGIRIQVYKFNDNHFRMSPYAAVNYDILPGVSLYADFKPEMYAPDYLEAMKAPYINLNSGLPPAEEKIDFKAGTNIKTGNLFFDVYYGHRSIKNYIYISAPEATKDFTYYNTDLDYGYFGISAETVKTGGINLKAGYTYRNIIMAQGGVPAYFPLNIIDAEASYEAGSRKFTLGFSGRTEYMGDYSTKLPRYGVLDFEAAKKINPNFTVSGYINNILNNSHYLLYYYEELGINAGITCEFTF